MGVGVCVGCVCVWVVECVCVGGCSENYNDNFNYNCNYNFDNKLRFNSMFPI